MVIRRLHSDPRAAELVVLLGLGAPLAAVSCLMAVAALDVSRWLPAVAAVLVAHGALVVRRTRPAMCFGLVVTATAVLAASTGLFLTFPSVMVVPVAMFGYVVHGSPSATYVAIGTGLAGAALVAVRFSRDDSVVNAGYAPDARLLFVLLAAVVAAAWGLGLFRRSQLAHRALVRQQARLAGDAQARTAALEERARIARELHDIVAHSLAVMVTQARGGRYAARQRPTAATEALAVIEEAGRQAVADMRGLLTVLRSEAPEDAAMTPQPGLAGIPALVEQVRSAGLTVTCSEHGAPRPLGAATELAAYRLVQESLTNVIRHAGPGATAEVELSWTGGGLRVDVSDDGAGPAAGLPDGRGLAGMRERVAAAGGTVRAGRAADGGFLVSAELPVGAGETS